MKHSHFAILTAVSATLIAGVLYQTLVGNSFLDDPVLSGTLLATFIVAWLCWWGIVSRPKRSTLMRGALTGLLISLLAFPVAFAIALLIALPQSGNPDMGIMDYLLSIFIFSAFAVAVVGIYTIPIGLIGGAALAYLQSRVVREDR
jgi:hypothetical protein